MADQCSQKRHEYNMEYYNWWQERMNILSIRVIRDGGRSIEKQYIYS